MVEKSRKSNSSPVSLDRTTALKVAAESKPLPTVGGAFAPLAAEESDEEEDVPGFQSQTDLYAEKERRQKEHVEKERQKKPEQVLRQAVMPPPPRPTEPRQQKKAKRVYLPFASMPKPGEFSCCLCDQHAASKIGVKHTTCELDQQKDHPADSNLCQEPKRCGPSRASPSLPPPEQMKSVNPSRSLASGVTNDSIQYGPIRDLKGCLKQSFNSFTCQNITKIRAVGGKSDTVGIKSVPFVKTLEATASSAASLEVTESLVELTSKTLQKRGAIPSITGAKEKEAGVRQAVSNSLAASLGSYRPCISKGPTVSLNSRTSAGDCRL